MQIRAAPQSEIGTMTTRTLAILATFLCLLTVRSVAGQGGPLIAELITYPEVRRVIPADTAERFERWVNPNQEQRRAARDLIQASRAELAGVINRHLRTVRDDATLEELLASEKEVLRSSAKVERSMLEDLRETLTPEQAGGFARFERSHRRTLLRGKAVAVLAFDVAEFLVRKGQDVLGDNPVASVITRLDVEEDAAIVRERRAVLAYFENVRRGYDGSPESQARDRDTQKELRAADVELRRVQSAALLKLVGILPGEVGDALVLEVMRTRSKDFDRTAASPQQYPVVREVLALSLSEEQRARVKSILREADRQVLEIARRAVIDQATFELADDQAQRKYPTAPTNVFWGKASELRKQVSRDVLGLLTPEQRRAYDASTVLDPSDTSRVEDEP